LEPPEDELEEEVELLEVEEPEEEEELEEVLHLKPVVHVVKLGSQQFISPLTHIAMSVALLQSI